MAGEQKTGFFSRGFMTSQEANDFEENGGNGMNLPTQHSQYDINDGNAHLDIQVIKYINSQKQLCYVKPVIIMTLIILYEIF